MPNASMRRQHTDLDLLFRYAENLKFGELHIKFDKATGLRAIIAVHNLKNGPAIGGCRLVPYPTTDAAFEDAMRLARMMSYKAALSNLPHGGAKAVLMKPKVIKNREAYLEAFGDFVDSLGGKYITAVDSGTSPQDMDIIARRTNYVTCTVESKNSGDPSPQTALGVLRGIEAGVQYKLGKDNLKDIHVAIQGVGHVGYLLAKDLKKMGARLTICDINQHHAEHCAKELDAEICPVEKIYDVKADVFAPCALGAVLNLNTIKRLKASVVAGSANNQLAHSNHGAMLHERGILYCPDFAINAGGLIYVAAIYDHANTAKAVQQVKDIYQTSIDIFERAKRENRPTSEVAEIIALERLK